MIFEDRSSPSHSMILGAEEIEKLYSFFSFWFLLLLALVFHSLPLDPLLYLFFFFPQMLKSLHHPISTQLTSLWFFLRPSTSIHHPLYWQLALQVLLSDQYLNTRHFPCLILSASLQFAYNPTVSTWKLILRHVLPGIKVISHTQILSEIWFTVHIWQLLHLAI